MEFEILNEYNDGELWNKLMQLELVPRLDASWIPEIREEIYHYTTVAGLYGILTNDSIWASSAYYLNDSSEIEYGCSLVLWAIDEWRQVNAKNISFAVDVLNALRQAFTHPLSRLGRITTIYVTCFCEDGNLLSQWRTYGQAGGYALGFDAHLIRSSLDEGAFGELRLVDVLYDNSAQRNQIQSILRQSLVAVAQSGIQNQINPLHIGQLLAELVVCIQELLLDRIVAFKNPAFKEEKEWRLIVRPSLIRSQATAQVKAQVKARARKSNPTGSPFKFRQFRGSLIPYIELHPKEGKMPLRSIRLGPSLETERTGNALELLLATCGYKNIDVQGSDLPVIL
jgi:hypothetical protein